MNLKLNIVSHSEAETEGLGQRLAPMLRPGDVLVLTGELGTGKTAFVRGLARGLGIDENTVNSPSYTIVNEYPETVALYHFDLYRISDPSELYEVGWDEYRGRNGVIAVEWGERAGELLPPGYYRIGFKMIDESEREINIEVVQGE